VPKQNITLSIDRDVIKGIRDKLRQVYKLSGVVENYLGYLLRPYVYCVKCGKRIPYQESALGPLTSFLCGDDKDYARKAPEEMSKFAMRTAQILEEINIRKIPEESSE